MGTTTGGSQSGHSGLSPRPDALITVSDPLYRQADMYSTSTASVSPVSRMRENKEPTSGLEPLP